MSTRSVFLSALVAFAALHVRDVGARDVMQMASSVYVIRGEFPPGRQPDGNSVILFAPAGLIVIDTGRHHSHTQQILDFAAAGSRPVVAIVNTHWHLDHVGGNAMLRGAYPHLQVFASDTLRAAQSGFLRDYRQQLEQAIARAAPADDTSAWRAELVLIDAGPQLAPDKLIDKSQTMTIAGRKLRVHLERNAATAGDVWLEDRANDIVIAGDLVTLPVPFLDTACASDWEVALQHIAAVPFATLIPGHGAPMDRERFDLYRSAFQALRSCATSERTTQACAAEWIEKTGDLIESVDVPRVPAMLDYYVKQLRAPPQYCEQR